MRGQSTIESKSVLIKVVLKVIVANRALVGLHQPTLHKNDDQVDMWQQFGRFLSASSDLVDSMLVVLGQHLKQPFGVIRLQNAILYIVVT